LARQPARDTRRLANGVSLARVPGLTSPAFVGLGLWWHAGSRFESDAQAGWAHLLEHLWFRGGGRFTAADVDRATDRLGGAVNAETGREVVGLHGLAPAGDAGELAELLLDLFLEPAFTAADLDLERRLIGAEATSVAADPLQAAIDRAFSEFFPGHPLGVPVVGRVDTVAAATSAAVRRWRSDHLSGERIAVTLLGPWGERSLTRMTDRLAQLPRDVPVAPGAAATPDAAATRGIGSLHGSQLWAFPLPGFATAGFHSAELLVAGLAGGLNALLPARLRRRMGLAYDVRSWIEPAFDVSLGMILVDSVPPEAVAETERLLDTVAAGGLPADVVEDVVTAARAGRTLSTANPVAAMRRLGWETLAGIAPTAPPDRRALTAPWPTLAADRRRRFELEQAPGGSIADG